jgi:uncharacterized protein YceH (UPF0502 family)
MVAQARLVAVEMARGARILENLEVRANRISDELDVEYTHTKKGEKMTPRFLA